MFVKNTLYWCWILSEKNDDVKTPYSALTDRQLVEKMKRGDEAAFTAIYERYWKEVFGHAYKRLQETSAAEDVVQNVFVSIWQRREQADIRNLRSYLYGAVRYQIFRQIDRSDRYVHFFDPFEAMIVSPVRSDHNMIRDDLSKILLAWIDTLPRKRREIFVLHYQDQLSVPEIAVRLGITRKTVYNQLNNSVKDLKWKLTQYYTLLMVVSSALVFCY